MGHSTAFHLTPGQADDREGANAPLPDMQGATVIADKTYDAHERDIAPLEKADKGVVIPSICTCKQPRDYDRHLYQAAT